MNYKLSEKTKSRKTHILIVSSKREAVGKPICGLSKILDIGKEFKGVINKEDNICKGCRQKYWDIENESNFDEPKNLKESSKQRG